MATNPCRAASSPSRILLARIEMHRAAYRAYDRILPRADPQDDRFDPGAVASIGLRQRREARRRLDLLAHPVGSLADMRAKADKPSGRFHARMTASEDRTGVLCNQSYLSIHAEAPLLEAAVLAHNSMVAVYFHFLTSGRFAAYRPKLSKDEILNLPIPLPASQLLDGITDYTSLDARAFALFGLKDAERVLVEDALAYTLEDFLGGEGTKGHQPTALQDSGEEEAHMQAYCTYFTHVLKAGFGAGKSVSAIIYRAVHGEMPYRLVAFVLGNEEASGVQVRDIQSRPLLDEFARLNAQDRNENGGIFNQRIARVYDASGGLPTIFMIKPDQKRFWTRSIGLQDGDDVALDLFRWQQAPSEGKGTLN